MKDIPVFTTENGIASLTLQEIPTQGCAYIKLQASQLPEKLLEECIGFCRMVGAERIYAAGDQILEQYPLHTALWEMACLRDMLGETDTALWPVQEQTLEAFRKLYNQKIKGVPNAAWMSEAEGKRMQKAGEGYFVHRAGELLGIGIVAGEELRFVASVVPGGGCEVVRALAHAVQEERLTLQVASENKKAVALYERLGFLKVREISRWYRVFG